MSSGNSYNKVAIFNLSSYIILGIDKNNTDRKLDVVFSRFRGFSFTIALRRKL